MNLRTSAPYGFTKKEITVFNLTSLTAPQIIVLKNISNVMNPKYNDYIYEPEIKVALSGGNTGFTLTNTTNANNIFGFTGLTANETITIYSDKSKIKSSTGQPRISNLINKNWFKLVPGNNYISINTPMTLTVTEEYPIYI
jgi:phage-related protein